MSADLAAPRTVRVLVADDQPLIRSALRALLETADDIDVVGEAGDGQAAVAAAGTMRPDVVLMDIRMPGMDGLAATRLITERHPDVAVVVLTTFDLDEYVYSAVRSGARGFLLKDGDADDLVRGIRTAAKGEALVDPGALRRLLNEFAAAPQPDPTATAAVASLTVRERDVLRLVAAGLNNAEIAEDLVLSEATVKTHVSNLLAKLGARDRVAAVLTAYAAGIVVGWAGPVA